MSLGALWLQLWVWQGGTLLPSSGLPLAPNPLSIALHDVDSLLRVFALADTVSFSHELSPSIRLVRTSEGVQLWAADSGGWVHALYVLLEEKHGFCFVHPKVTARSSHLRRWDTLFVQPRFRWRGFHLHTQHPLELTEALHTPHFPQAERLIREYIAWLARNRQNFFEFCLLRTVRLAEWLPHFARIVAYAKARGITVGVDLSLRMQQQKAFQLLPRYTFRSKRRQLRLRLQQLASTGIARLNVDLNAAEFVGKSWGRWVDTLLLYAHQQGIIVMSRQHVVPPEAYAVGDFHPSELPLSLTLCVHSVMCYGLRDSIAPVYRCRNFRHLWESLMQESQRRAVWYYPETAYWVTFDNSVPVWLLSYLRSRAEDILLVERVAEGHLTFSSGWDVGYWLFDWSVARWSWRYRYGVQEESIRPAEGLVRLFGGDTATWERLVRFQDSVLVGRDALSYITPTTPIDEISWYKLPPFQPRLPIPPWKVYRKPHKYRTLLEGKVVELEHALSQWPSWPEETPTDSLQAALWVECQTAWELTRLRVQFRTYWLKALLSERRSIAEQGHLHSLHTLLPQAEKLVLQLPVRYPHTAEEGLCRAGQKHCRHPHPSYRFGYLYPALSLHFWRREIGQIEEGRWGVLYRNLWDIPRIVGLW